MDTKIKQQLVDIFYAGANAVSGFQATHNALINESHFTPNLIIAVGKAASGMCAGALATMTDPCPALLITKYQHTDQAMHDHPTVTVIEAAHPVPDENSLLAGQAMLSAVSDLSASSKLLLLVSGGTSALSELLPAEMSLAEWQNLTQKMLACGFNIGQINAQRKQTSLIKDGKLLKNFTGEQLLVLAISDVEGDDISVIGSGTGDPKHATTNKTLKLIGTNQVARLACATTAQDLDYKVQVNIENLYKDIHQAAIEIAQHLTSGPKGLYIFGGEPTVNLPENPGSGGRNQSLALTLALHIRGLDNIYILVAGTDGSDGPTDAAGGIVDGQTVQDVAAAKAALQEADAGSYLRQTGHIFITGPTNTNVMDLVIAVKL